MTLENTGLEIPRHRNRREETSAGPSQPIECAAAPRVKCSLAGKLQCLIPIGAKIWWGLRAYSAAYRGGKAIRLCDHSFANCADVLTNATTGGLTGSLIRGSDDCSAINTCTISIVYDQSGQNLCGGSPPSELGGRAVRKRAEEPSSL